jgi:hypothetical protein
LHLANKKGDGLDMAAGQFAPASRAPTAHHYEAGVMDRQAFQSPLLGKGKTKVLRITLTVLSGLIVASLAACGSSPSTSSSSASSPTAAAKSSTAPGPIHACAAFTVQDANQLTGETFASGTEAGLSCSYMSGNSLVALTIVQAASSVAVQAALAQQQQAMGASGFTKTQLSGADSAYEFLQGANGLNVIEVIRGNILFVIEAVGSAPSEAAIKVAATTVLGRLP